MKKLFLFSLAIMAVAVLNVCAAPIDSYQRLTSAMLEGKQFLIILDIAQCTGRPDMPTLYFTPTLMVLTPATNTTQEYVSVSQIQLYKTAISDNLTYLSLKYLFYPDNTVQVHAAGYYVNNFNSTGEPLTFTTSLNEGIYVKTLDRAEKDDVTP